jgi:hypothetical protein
MVFAKSGAPEGIRTPGPLLRRQLLYPTELQARRKTIIIPEVLFRVLKNRVYKQALIIRSYPKFCQSCVDAAGSFLVYYRLEAVKPRGRLAQLGERHVRNVEVEGSNPLPSTIFFL